MRTTYELTKILHDRLDKVLEEMGSTRRAAEVVGGISHTWWNHRGRFNMPLLVKISDRDDEEAAAYARELIVLRKNPQMLYGPNELNPTGMQTLIERSRGRFYGRPSTTGDDDEHMMVHVALQLEAADFPGGTLKNAIADNALQDAVHRAAVSDLVLAFVNAKFFSRYALAIRLGHAVPTHPFSDFEISESLDPRLPSVSAPERAESWVERFFASGNKARDIFEQTTDQRGTGRLHATVSEIERVGAVESYALYDCLAEIVDFSDGRDCQAYHRQLVLACSATAALRAELAAMHAANAIRQTWYSSGVLARAPLYRVASKIYELCCATYLSTAERVGEAIKALPYPETDRATRDCLGYAYATTSQALLSDDGLWFDFADGKKVTLAFLSRHGSLLQAYQASDTGPVYHRHVTGEGELLPVGYNGNDEIHSF